MMALPHFYSSVALVDKAALLSHPMALAYLQATFSTVIIPQVVVRSIRELQKKCRRINASDDSWLTLKNLAFALNHQAALTFRDATETDDIVAIARLYQEKYPDTPLTIVTAEPLFVPVGENILIADFMQSYQSHYFDNAEMPIDPIMLSQVKNFDRKALVFPKHFATHGVLANGQTLLTNAIVTNELNKARFLLAFGADIDQNDQSNHFFTPLHQAVYHNSIDAVRLCMGFGANINAQIRTPRHNPTVWAQHAGETPLMLAVTLGFTDIVDRLLIHPHIDLTLKDHQGETVFDKAEKKKNDAILSLLREVDAH